MKRFESATKLSEDPKSSDKKSQFSEGNRKSFPPVEDQEPAPAKKLGKHVQSSNQLRDKLSPEDKKSSQDKAKARKSFPPATKPKTATATPDNPPRPISVISKTETLEARPKGATPSSEGASSSKKPPPAAAKKKKIPKAFSQGSVGLLQQFQSSLRKKIEAVTRSTQRPDLEPIDEDAPTSTSVNSKPGNGRYRSVPKINRNSMGRSDEDDDGYVLRSALPDQGAKGGKQLPNGADDADDIELHCNQGYGLHSYDTDKPAEPKGHFLTKQPSEEGGYDYVDFNTNILRPARK